MANRFQKWVLGPFILIALYTPLLWFIQHVMDREEVFSYEDFTTIEKVFVWILSVLPLIAILTLFRDTKGTE